MPIQRFSPYWSAVISEKNAWLPPVFFLDFNSPWYDCLVSHSHYLGKNTSYQWAPSLKFYDIWQNFYFYRILNNENLKMKVEQTNFMTHLIIESLSNSRRRRRSGRPEVKMHYWRLLRMQKTKFESSFSGGRLATRVSEVVFGRWVFIHFFCLLSNMPWKHNHISVFLMIFWNQRYLSDSSWRNWSFLLIEELSPLF